MPQMPPPHPPHHSTETAKHRSSAQPPRSSVANTQAHRSPSHQPPVPASTIPRLPPTHSEAPVGPNLTPFPKPENSGILLTSPPHQMPPLYPSHSRMGSRSSLPRSQRLHHGNPHRSTQNYSSRTPLRLFPKRTRQNCLQKREWRNN